MARERSIARISASALVSAAALALAEPAEASKNDVVIFTVATAVPGAVSTLFLSYDIATAGRGAQASRGWSIAEIASTAPFAVFYDVMLIALDYGLVHNDSDVAFLMPLIMLGAAGTSMLTTHGIWSLAIPSGKPGPRPGVVMGGSLALGADISMTSMALAAAFQGRLENRIAGITQMVLTVPQVIAGSYQLATTPDDRALWATVTAWSGALFVHGLASAIKGKLRHRDAIPCAPCPPPEQCPPPPACPPPPEKSPLMVPASTQWSPVMVSDGVARGLGLGVSGVF